ncbi:Uncharacterised protein [Wolbachia endosymbiont wPip_Mol of Culex molestus]|nr:Uncharacterised protein [Wolbachia endosymbiont wPip_Mol of Culex molestus]
MTHPILPNFLELAYFILLSVLPVPIDSSIISSFGNNLLALAYAQAAGLLANTPPSINTLSVWLIFRRFGVKYVGAAVVALSASFNLMFFSFQLLKKNSQLL